MRVGIVLEAPFSADAVRVEELGFDLAWISAPSSPAPLVTAAGLSAVTSGIRMVAVAAAGTHPVLLAEEAAVADLVCGGRLALVLDDAEQALLRETVEIVLRAWAARPFRHAGDRWNVPARLSEHEPSEPRVRVTPPPAQLEPTVWLSGDAAAAVAREYGLAPVFADDRAATAFWSAADRAAGAVVLRLRRPGIVRVHVGRDGELDAAGLEAALRARQDAWGIDVAVLELPTGLRASARERALRAIASSVRPALQLDRLPAPLVAEWRAEATGK